MAQICPLLMQTLILIIIVIQEKTIVYIVTEKVFTEEQVEFYNGYVTISRCYNENGQIHTNRKQMDYIAVPEELRLGCYRSNVGGTGRFAKDIMNDCKVYNYALSDEQINKLLVS